MFKVLKPIIHTYLEEKASPFNDKFIVSLLCMLESYEDVELKKRLSEKQGGVRKKLTNPQ